MMAREAALEPALEGAGVADLESLLLLLIPEATWEMSGSCDIVAVEYARGRGCSGIIDLR